MFSPWYLQWNVSNCCFTEIGFFSSFVRSKLSVLISTQQFVFSSRLELVSWIWYLCNSHCWCHDYGSVKWKKKLWSRMRNTDKLFHRDRHTLVIGECTTADDDVNLSPKRWDWMSNTKRPQMNGVFFLFFVSFTKL